MKDSRRQLGMSRSESVPAPRWADAIPIAEGEEPEWRRTVALGSYLSLGVRRRMRASRVGDARLLAQCSRGPKSALDLAVHGLTRCMRMGIGPRFIALPRELNRNPFPERGECALSGWADRPAALDGIRDDLDPQSWAPGNGLRPANGGLRGVRGEAKRPPPDGQEHLGPHGVGGG